MARELHRVKIAPKGMGLNDFVAMQEGFFAAEGLDVELDWKTFRGTQSSWKDLQYFQRPQDRPYTQDKAEVIQGACVWGSICNASAGMGRFVADAYGVSPWAIFVRPDSRIHQPRDLKDVPIAVGMRAGSHFNVPYRLEKFLPLENIKTVNTGGFGARLKALLDGEVEAASLLPPQIAMAEQLGLRKIIEDTFHTLWWVPDGSPPEVVTGYLRALDRAEKAMDADLEKYLPLWKLAVPAEFETTHPWDFTRFGRGERFVYETIPRSEFDEVMDQVKRWGLDDYLKDRELREFGGRGGAVRLSSRSSLPGIGRSKDGSRAIARLCRGNPWGVAACMAARRQARAWRTLRLRPSRKFLRRREVPVAAHRGAHQEAVAFLDDALGVTGLDVRMADDDAGFLAGVDDLRHGVEHHLVLVLARIAELLGEVAFADQDGADAGHVLQDVVEILDALGVLDHAGSRKSRPWD